MTENINLYDLNYIGSYKYTSCCFSADKQGPYWCMCQILSALILLLLCKVALCSSIVSWHVSYRTIHQTLLEPQLNGYKTHTMWHSLPLSTDSSKASEIIQDSLHTSVFLPLSQLVIKIIIPWCVSCLKDKTDGVVLTYTSLHCEEQWPRLPSTSERNGHCIDRHKQPCRPQISGGSSLELDLSCTKNFKCE